MCARREALHSLHRTALQGALCSHVLSLASRANPLLFLQRTSSSSARLPMISVLVPPVVLQGVAPVSLP